MPDTLGKAIAAFLEWEAHHSSVAAVMENMAERAYPSEPHAKLECEKSPRECDLRGRGKPRVSEVRMSDDTTPPHGPNPSGLCQCGCGRKAPRAKRTQARLGLVKGQPQRFIFGHRFTRVNTIPILTIEKLAQRAVVKNDCWEWQGSRDENGYGRLKFEGKPERAHRVAYALVKGSIPEGKCICHTCDNPPCINPKHLFLGSKNDNNLDKKTKGRARGGGVNPNPAKGTAHGRAKLIDEQVMAIRAAFASGETQSSVAKRYGVSLSTVHLIVHRKHWRHLP